MRISCFLYWWWKVSKSQLLIWNYRPLSHRFCWRRTSKVLWAQFTYSPARVRARYGRHLFSIDRKHLQQIWYRQFDSRYNLRFPARNYDILIGPTCRTPRNQHHCEWKFASWTRLWEWFKYPFCQGQLFGIAQWSCRCCQAQLTVFFPKNSPSPLFPSFIIIQIRPIDPYGFKNQSYRCKPSYIIILFRYRQVKWKHQTHRNCIRKIRTLH